MFMENVQTQEKKRNWVTPVLLVLGILCVGWFAWAIWGDIDEGTVGMGGGVDIEVRIADNPFEHAKGLSGTLPDTIGADGMLFVFDEQAERVFTMKGMKYNLDFIWIKDGKVVRIDENVPAPAPGEDPVQVSSKPLRVDMVLEVPAGIARQLGYVEGNDLTIQY